MNNKKISYKSKPIKITHFSTETLKARREWSKVNILRIKRKKFHS
jgi:hypothetical protein